ncbi:MAG: tRNA pseudouridine(55) synthase TruB [Lachnospiraceae bacterium]|nr:tRNA pseudouridine(55) synthase TruB [Lachnospiraceae bacterium]
MQGIIAVNKDRGFTSFDVVAKLRGILKTKKIGHTGTLDPEARGVLVVCVGKATKLVEALMDHDKTYEAGLLLGRETDTCDIWGETISENVVDVTEDQVRQVIKGFIGPQKQTPPMYSAKKVDGKKLYELAREGKTVERKSADIEIYDIKITDISLPEVRFTVSCSKGTYIRSLCHDIGEKLGCGGCMSSLLRTQTGDFTLEDAHSLDEIQNTADEGRIEDILIPIDRVLGYKKAYVLPDSAKALENGNRLGFSDVKTDEDIGVGEPVCTYHPDGRFAATYVKDKNGYRLDKYYLE